MEFRILGSMEVLDGDRRIELPAGRSRALLALLVLHAGEMIPSERLVDELWGEDPPPTAATVVQGLVSKLRKLIEPGRGKGEPPSILQTVGPGYRLAVDPDAVDANRFKRMFDEARRATVPGRSAMLADALQLWRGPPLADFTFAPFAQHAITALEELHLAAIEDRIDADLDLGSHGAVVAELEELVATHPFRERLRGQLMLALYRGGRQAEALESYQSTRQVLVDELGIEPGEELRDLQQAILRQDRSLEAEGRAREPEIREPGEAEHWLPRERRTVTVVVVDLAASGEPEADIEMQRRFVRRSLDVTTDVLRRHGARVEQVVGDTLMGLFGLTLAHEDDALRAVRAAVEARSAIGVADDDTPPDSSPFRAGVETGEVVLGASDSLQAPTGQVLTLAARLQQAAANGEVLVGPATRRLIRGAAVLSPAGGADSGAWRVMEVASDAPAIARQLDAPTVGRAAELTRLRTTFSATVRRGKPYRLTVLGEAGVGKSRLALELAESIGSDAQIATGQCPAYGDGITFLPLREVVLEAAGPRGWAALSELLDAEEDGAWIAGQIGGAIGMTPQQGKPQELFPAVRRLFEILAARHPLAVVIEDLHWAEPTFLDMISYLAESVRGPLFLLCLARPELIEERPLWGAGSPNADVLFLEPLEASDIEELISVRAAAMPPPDTLRRIVGAARGNPLFAEQLLASFEEHELETIPVSLQSLLAMRLDRLGPGERDLLRRAAIIGNHFGEDSLLALIPERARSFVDRHLRSLERKRLIARGPAELRFGHALIRRAAYRSITREDRAHLHLRFADWLETEGRPPELDEIAGFHLEQAVEHRRAIGLPDVPLAVRAGERLARAGGNAFGRFDVPAAEGLLSRARALLPADHAGRSAVTQRLAEVSLPLGRHDRAQELLVELIEAARADGDRSSERYGELERARIQMIIGPDPLTLDEIRREAQEAGEFFEGVRDEAGLARASFLLGFVHQRAGRIGAAEEALRQSLTYADRSGHIREEHAARWVLASTIVLGPTPVSGCVDECRKLPASRDSEHPGILRELAILSAMAGDLKEARELSERVRWIFVERMRVRRMLMFLAQSNATIELLAGDTGAAERELRAALDLARETGERDAVSQTSARLSLVLQTQARPEEASVFASLSEQAAPSEGVAAQALSRAAKARVISGEGNHEEAEALAREAVGVASDEMPNLRADLLVELAEVLRAGDKEQSAAAAALEEAADLYERKGNKVSLARLTPLTMQ